MNKVFSLDVTLSDPKAYGDKEVIGVRIGTNAIGYLYRDISEVNWYVYGYYLKPDNRGRKGYARDILGEDPSYFEMAKRLLAYKGYIPSSHKINLRGCGLVHNARYDAVILEDVT